MSESPIIVGDPSNFWLWTETDGFDLTHPSTPNSPPIYPRVKIQTVTSPITITPTKTAMVIIDMQNYFLSAALGRAKGEGLKAQTALLEHAIPAARKAGIRIIWLNWGLTEESLKKAPPAMYRAFGFQKSKIEERASLSRSETASGTSNNQPNTANEKKASQDIGLSLGPVMQEDGTNIDAGLMLMRDQWNTALHPPLDKAYREGLNAKVPDVWFHKDRPTGLWGGSTECEAFLEAQGIRTLLFAGVNADQCVLSTLQDANSKGFDCILLRDCSGSTSPGYAGLAVEFNCANTWGFMSSGERLAEGVENIESESPSDGEQGGREHEV